MKAPLRRLAVYARVSTAYQDALPQVERLREWAHSAGFRVALERVDVASGRKVVRPGMDDVMAAARGHHVHAVAVAKVDRWARSIQHLSSTVNELHTLGVDFYAVDQGLTVRRNDPTSVLILNILGAVAQWEASIISERTKDTLSAKKADGQRLGRASKPCVNCRGPRERPTWGKRRGVRVPLCSPCKGRQTVSPALVAEAGSEKGG